MSPILAAILISISLTLFFLFLTLKIDHSIKWNWFFVFIPLFLLKFLMLFHSIILLKKRIRFKVTHEILKIFVYILTIILTLAFEILICIKLEYYAFIKLTIVFVPLWVVILIVIIFLIKQLSN